MATVKEKDIFKTKNCKVLNYNSVANYADIDFQGYGIRINNVVRCNGNYITVKYKGEIGNSNFICRV